MLYSIDFMSYKFTHPLNDVYKGGINCNDSEQRQLRNQQMEGGCAAPMRF